MRLERAHKLDDSMLRVPTTTRLAVTNKDAAAATAVYDTFDKKLAAAIRWAVGRPARK